MSWLTIRKTQTEKGKRLTGNNMEQTEDSFAEDYDNPKKYPDTPSNVVNTVLCVNNLGQKMTHFSAQTFLKVRY